ncbi:hypothetical protein F2Q69_00030458 [Brassica cretica]|uniref:Uncharacterized protein n=1 Tax=Brassica cretica TaxID=69181 RepID=A0A8S9RZC3_BRACR|nr:hypothetical protein F2Q69_00030458 [Brassica cretica]
MWQIGLGCGHVAHLRSWRSCRTKLRRGRGVGAQDRARLQGKSRVTIIVLHDGALGEDIPR